jgi:hypothetical protein
MPVILTADQLDLGLAAKALARQRPNERLQVVATINEMARRPETMGIVRRTSQAGSSAAEDRHCRTGSRRACECGTATLIERGNGSAGFSLA